MSGSAMSSAMFAAFTEPPYWMRTAAAASAPPIGRRRPSRTQPHTAWASSGVAVRPVPIAQIGS